LKVSIWKTKSYTTQAGHRNHQTFGLDRAKLQKDEVFGCSQGTEGLWLRWYDASGWIPTLFERAESENQRAILAEQQIATERAMAERLAEYLRSQGINPDSLR
jgi:hypothetical protein